LADALAAAGVFVVGDVADAGVQSHGVVLEPAAVEFAFELAGVADALEVRPLARDVTEQGLESSPAKGLTGAVGAYLRPLSEIASSSGTVPSVVSCLTRSRSPSSSASRSAAVARGVGGVEQGPRLPGSR
jgi:hypothetical protein